MDAGLCDTPAEIQNFLRLTCQRSRIFVFLPLAGVTENNPRNPCSGLSGLRPENFVLWSPRAGDRAQVRRLQVRTEKVYRTHKESRTSAVHLCDSSRRSALLALAKAGSLPTKVHKALYVQQQPRTDMQEMWRLRGNDGTGDI